MNQFGMQTGSSKEECINSKGHTLIALWAVGIVTLYAVGTIAGVNLLKGYREETDRVRQVWLESTTTGLDGTETLQEITPGEEATEVRTGIFVNNIGDISLSESAWTADLYIWFKWDGEDINPGETFRIVNGTIETLQQEESRVDGTIHYERYHVIARLRANIDPSRFPFSDHALAVQMEDRVSDINRLLYVPEESISGVSNQASTNLEITRALATVKQHIYDSSFSQTEYDSEARSRFIFAFLVTPNGGKYFLKLFQALFASVAIAFVAFFIKPTQVDARFGVGVGAFFAAVGNNIYVASVLPDAAGTSLADMINGIGLVTIFLTIVHSSISLYLYETKGQEKLSRLFDHVTFAVMLPCCLIINIVLPVVAG